MEILLGVILLLQVVILIQIMHGRNLVLQCFENVEKKMKAGGEAKETMQDVLTTAECVTSDLQWESQVSQEKPTIEQIEKTSPEALLNEVLSEVFS